MRNVSAVRPRPVRSTWRATEGEHAAVTSAPPDGGRGSPPRGRRQVLADRRRRDVERGELLDQPQRTLAVGALVHAVERRDRLRVEQPLDLLVRRDHEVLDYPVRLGLLARPRRGDVAADAEVALRLACLDLERVLLQAALMQRRGDGARGLERLCPRFLRRLLPGEDAL